METSRRAFTCRNIAYHYHTVTRRSGSGGCERKQLENVSRRKRGARAGESQKLRGGEPLCPQNHSPESLSTSQRLSSTAQLQMAAPFGASLPRLALGKEAAWLRSCQHGSVRPLVPASCPKMRGAVTDLPLYRPLVKQAVEPHLARLLPSLSTATTPPPDRLLLPSACAPLHRPLPPS